MVSLSFTTVLISAVTFSWSQTMLALVLGMFPAGGAATLDYDVGEELTDADEETGVVSHSSVTDHSQPIYNNLKVYETITRSAAGFDGKLGSLWEDISAKVLHAGIFRTVLPEEFIESVQTPKTTYTANLMNTMEEKMENYFIGVEQSCSLFGSVGGGAEISYSTSDSGSAQKNKNAESYIFSGISRSHYNSFNENNKDLADIYDHSRIVANSMASHVIVGIYFGVRFDVKISLAEGSSIDTAGSETAFALKLAAKELQAGYELKNSTSKNLQRATTNFNVQFEANLAAPVFDHGDSPWEIIKAVPRALQEAHGAGAYMALEYKLLPIEAFYKFLSPKYLDDLKALGHAVAPLYPLQEKEADALRKFMSTFNERKSEVSQVCDSIQENIRKFTKNIRDNPLVSRCAKVKAGEPSVRAELLNVLREVRLDDGDNYERVNQLYNYTDAIYVSEAEIEARSVVGAHMQRFIIMKNKLAGSGISVADDKTAILNNMLTTREASYVLFYNSTQILNLDESEYYIRYFEWNVEKIIAIKAKFDAAQYISIDCSESHIETCPCYGGFEYKDLHISEYKYTALENPDLLHFWAKRKDYCGINKICTSDNYFKYGNIPCREIVTYPFCIQPPQHLDTDENLMA